MKHKGSHNREIKSSKHTFEKPSINTDNTDHTDRIDHINYIKEITQLKNIITELKQQNSREEFFYQLTIFYSQEDISRCHYDPDIKQYISIYLGKKPPIAVLNVFDKNFNYVRSMDVQENTLLKHIKESIITNDSLFELIWDRHYEGKFTKISYDEFLYVDYSVVQTPIKLDREQVIDKIIDMFFRTEGKSNELDCGKNFKKIYFILTFFKIDAEILSFRNFISNPENHHNGNFRMRISYLLKKVYYNNILYWLDKRQPKQVSSNYWKELTVNESSNFNILDWLVGVDEYENGKKEVVLIPPLFGNKEEQIEKKEKFLYD